MFILDTDHLSFLERGSHPVGARILARMKSEPDQCFATIISYEEQTRGWFSVLAQAKTVTDQIRAYEKLLAQLRNYCSIKVLAFDEKAATKFQDLKRSKIRIATMDLKMASMVLAHDATLATRNFSDFVKVPGLKLEDWTKE
ncbi:MAG: type II toxin-antitoxin system VapC family toxin [Planctomycetes bacterium]|nr:type II toxin-antitoxin system VapC family toxin [Planctomycetota bacterium]